MTNIKIRLSQGLTGPAGTGGGVSDGDKGDIVVSGSGTVYTIDALAVNAAKLAANAVTTAKIQDDAVTGDKIADGAVGTAHLADDTVTAAKLADTAVTAGSYTLANITVDQQGRITAASSGMVVLGSAYANDAAAVAGGGSIGQYYYLSAANTYGVPGGLLKRIMSTEA